MKSEAQEKRRQLYELCRWSTDEVVCLVGASGFEEAANTTAVIARNDGDIYIGLRVK